MHIEWHLWEVATNVPKHIYNIKSLKFVWKKW